MKQKFKKEKLKKKKERNGFKTSFKIKTNQPSR